MASIPRVALVLLPLLSAACVTTTGRMDLDCEQGQHYACSTWGEQLLAQGEKQQAENAFGRSCEGGIVSDCLTQGKLMMERGELDGAEPPLRKAYESEDLEATMALIELHQTRRAPGDLEQASRLSWEAPAIDKPDREFMFWIRPSPTGDTSYAVAYYFQPMEFYARRMTLGLHSSWNGQGYDELNVALGYQHFLTPEIVPYGTLLVGGTFQKRSFNMGGEAGLKFCLGAIAHLNLGVGSSVASPFHASIGVGINSLPVDILLLIAAHAR